MARPTYTLITQHYSASAHNCPGLGSPQHQCALKLSRTLIASGIALNPYAANKCPHGLARGAQDLAAFLQTQWGPRDQGFSNPGLRPASLAGKHGIIVFCNIPDFEGQGHIDVFDGNVGLEGTYWDADPIWFWELTGAPDFPEHVA